MTRASKIMKKLPPKLIELGILPKWHDAVWDDFTNDDRAKKIISNYLRNITDAEKDAVGFFIYGAQGVGKSLVANLTFKDVLAMGKTVRVISLGGLVDLVTKSWSDEDAKKTYTKLVQTTKFLCIEDFGKEFYRKDSDGKSFATSILEDVMIKRIGFRNITFIVSSISATLIKDTYSADLASIVKETCVPLQILGDDFRIGMQEDFKERYRSEGQKKYTGKD